MTGIIPLQNNKNWCWLNALIQILHSCHFDRHIECTACTSKVLKEKCFACIFLTAVTVQPLSNKTVQAIKNIIKKQTTDDESLPFKVSDGIQYDPLEWLQSLIGVNKNIESFFTKHFLVQSAFSIVCRKCNYESEKICDDLWLSLSVIDKKNVPTHINYFMKEDNDDAYCKSCTGKLTLDRQFRSCANYIMLQVN